MNWKTTNEDFDTMARIAKRAAEELGLDYQATLMDLNATHCNGNPLDLAGLLAADRANFAHDIAGIYRHLNRDTGKLMQCFVPRYTARVEATATLEKSFLEAMDAADSDNPIRAMLGQDN